MNLIDKYLYGKHNRQAFMNRLGMTYIVNNPHHGEYHVMISNHDISNVWIDLEIGQFIGLSRKTTFKKIYDILTMFDYSYYTETVSTGKQVERMTFRTKKQAQIVLNYLIDLLIDYYRENGTLAI